MFRLLLLLGATSSLFASFPIECEGRTEVTYLHPQKKSWHRITCYDPVQIDWNRHFLRCLRSQEEPHTQIQFVDEERKIYADNMIVHYALYDNSLDLHHLTIFGKVKLLQLEKIDENSPPHIQYALADCLEYSHREEELLLTSDAPKNVLYFDETHHHKMSAPQILIKRNPKTNKLSVQGIGAVHFTFEEEELKNLKQNFKRRPAL